MTKRQTVKKTVDALNKYLPATRQLTVPKACRKKRVSKKIKLVELDTVTFGSVIVDAPKTAYGFVYMLTIRTSTFCKYYVGSRHFDDARDWKNYCTSNDTCKRLISASRMHPEQVNIKWEVLEYAPTAGMLKTRENVRMRGVYSRVGKDNIINVADPFGYSLRTGKSLRK